MFTINNRNRNRNIMKAKMLDAKRVAYALFNEAYGISQALFAGVDEYAESRARQMNKYEHVLVPIIGKERVEIIREAADKFGEDDICAAPHSAEEIDGVIEAAFNVSEYEEEENAYYYDKPFRFGPSQDDPDYEKWRHFMGYDSGMTVFF